MKGVRIYKQINLLFIKCKFSLSKDALLHQTMLAIDVTTVVAFHSMADEKKITPNPSFTQYALHSLRWIFPTEFFLGVYDGVTILKLG